MKRALDLDQVLSDTGPKIWEMAKLCISEYSRLPLGQKHDLIKKHKPSWLVSAAKSEKVIRETTERLKRERPMGGYLLDAYFKDEAEKKTIADKEARS